VAFSKEFYDGRWEQANIPIKMRGFRIKDYKPVSNSGGVAALKAQDFIDDFSNRFISDNRAAAGDLPEDRSRIGQGMMLLGPNGTRKTTLGIAVLTELQYISLSYRGFYIRFSEWQRCLTDTYSKDNSARITTAKKMLALAEFMPIVLLDDLGQEYRTASGFTRDKFNEFLRVRYDAARPTIVTTNEDPDSIREIYGKSLDSFRHDAFGEPIQLLGRDSRKPGRN
jgi:DNA replication protein DnaC